jgi:hypothetical protein
MKTLILAAALLLCAAAPAAAQEAPSPGEMQAVREFLEVTRVRDNFARTVELMLESSMITGDEDLPPGFADLMREFMGEHFTYEVLEPGFVRVYTELFTEEEIRALTAFYRTPAGQRFVELTPELTARTQEVTNEIMQEAMPELMQAIMEMAEEEEGSPRKAPPVRGKS